MELKQIGKAAKKASYLIGALSQEKKNQALYAAAGRLKEDIPLILAANERDMEKGRQKGLSEGLLDRLLLTRERIESMALGLAQIALLPDPVGELLEQFDRPNGLHIEKRRVPFGVVGIIYEARPNVTADAFGLCLKSGNAVILKGGTDALCSNEAIARSLRTALKEQGLPEDGICLITDTSRQAALDLMTMKEYVDVLIPRGGAGLIRTVVENSTVPVIETGTGNCHIYVDEDADLDMALSILINAKTQRVGVCNACESLLVHEKVAGKFLPIAFNALSEKKVEIFGDKICQNLSPDVKEATEEDWGKEYLALAISAKVVSGIEEAIEHINRYHTGHSDAIITENKEHGELFLKQVDSACVYVNASTRFTDGFEFGFGAEIGISTQKLHARGPMGLKELTSYKYYITGNGQIRT